MRFRRQQQSLRARKGLSLEQLEPRALMAADAGLAAASLVAPAATTAADPASLLANSRTPNSGWFNPGPTIPATTIPPRSIDGTGNNRANPDWGSTGEQLLREAPADYGDGISSMAG